MYSVLFIVLIDVCIDIDIDSVCVCLVVFIVNVNFVMNFIISGQFSWASCNKRRR